MCFVSAVKENGSPLEVACFSFSRRLLGVGPPLEKLRKARPVGSAASAPATADTATAPLGKKAASVTAIAGKKTSSVAAIAGKKAASATAIAGKKTAAAKMVRV